MNDTEFVDLEVDFAGFHIFHGFAYLHGNRTGLGVRHKAAGTQDTTEGTDLTHNVGCFIVLGVCFVWLAVSGSWLLSAVDVFACIGVTVLSVLSASTLLVFLIGFLRSEGAFTGLNVIIGTVTGFLIGAYIPTSSFPEWVQYITLFVPGSYSAALFRTFFMDGAIGEMAEAVSLEFSEALADRFSVRLNFFGESLPAGASSAILAGTVVLFGICCVIAAVVRVRRHKV